jgi:hypothetical protein
MRRSPHPIALLTLLCGCSIDEERIWASVLANAPFIYMAGLALLHLLYTPWARAVPGLRFGNRSHWATLIVLVVLAVWAGPRARFDGVGAYWLFFGGTTLTLWLLVWRIALSWPRCQPFRWSGAAAFGLSASPAIAGLASPVFADYGEAGIPLWIFGSGFGLSPLLVLAFVGWEARQVGRRAARPQVEQGPPAT